MKRLRMFARINTGFGPEAVLAELSIDDMMGHNYDRR
jgi:hypothetical protein